MANISLIESPKVRRHSCTIFIWAWFFLLGSIPFAWGAVGVPRIVTVQGVVEVDEEPFDGVGFFKVAIRNEAGTILWSNDGTLSGEPSEGLTVEVDQGLYVILLGDDTMDPIDPEVFNTSSTLFVRVWFDDGQNGFSQFEPDIQISTGIYAFQAETLQGLVPADFLLAGQAIPASLIVDGSIANSKLEAFAASGKTFKVGNATDNNISITAHIGATSAPALRYNVSLDQWEFSNNGSTFTALGSGGGGTSTTATALAANGANCAAGSYPLGVDASGASEGCTTDDDTPDGDSEVPNDLTIASTGTNAAGGSANPFDITSTLGIFDGSDDYTALDINLTNANHTGASNTLQGLDISGITSDVEAVETAIKVGAGWDVGLDLNQNTIVFEETGAGTETVTLQAPSAVTGNITLTLPASTGTVALTSDAAATATALAANGANCAAGNYPLGVDASGASEGCTADDDTSDGDAEVPNDLTIASTSQSQGFTFGASNLFLIDATTTANTGTSGVIDLNVGAGDAAVEGMDIGLTQNNGATAGRDAIAQNILLTGNDADGDLFGIKITGAATASAGAGTYEAGISIDNAEDTAGSMPDAIVITATTDTAITDGIDVSDPEIVNSINVGANPIITGNVGGTLGDSTTDSWTFTTDGTGNAEIALPTDSIGSGEILDATIAGSDLASNIAITSTGVQDYGGASSFEIPNGAGPTVDAAGEVAVDTTDDQLIFYGGAKRVIPYRQTKCIVVENLVAGDDNVPVFVFDKAATLAETSCYTTSTTIPSYTLEDNSGNAVTGSGTCVNSTSTATWTATTSGNTFVAGETLRFDTGTAADAATWTTICVAYTEDAQ